MQFIKKNYEKVLLGLVLFGLVVAVGFLPFLVSGEKQKLDDLRNTFINRKVNPLAEAPVDRYDLALRQVGTPIALDLSTTNKLFNPVRWLKGPNGSIKVPAGSELEKLEITRITDLFLVISLESVNVSDSGARYGIGVEQQAAPKAANRGRRTFYVSKDEKKEAFTVRAIKGPPENPTELILELPDADKPVSIAKDKPFKRVDGHLADLKYPPENRSFPNRRANDALTGRMVIAGETYNIVAIGENEVVLSAPNGKKYTIRSNAAP